MVKFLTSDRLNKILDMYFGMFQIKNFKEMGSKVKKLGAYKDIPRPTDKTSNFNLAGKL